MGFGLSRKHFIQVMPKSGSAEAGADKRNARPARAHF
jgi:hypothetical protein